ncbi:MAG TPA: 6-phosphogluconolactonase [Pyrinomonadaceae bacterium]|jgi:6-phosphogluconolactonase|nr:6-phosphogluconolactonase [Pyrinomonadaceae bacterium]
MIEIYSDANELALAAAEYFVAQCPETVALSGGSTPKLMFQVLAEQFRYEVAWSNIHFFWSDERHVPPDNQESNYRMANEALLSHVPVTADNIHRIRSENPDAAAVASEYEQTLIDVTKQTLPRLDLIFLGLGTDGHTASIFPGSEVMHETKRLVAAPYVEKFKSYRITMTLPLLNNGSSIVFLVSGAEKAEIVRAVIQGEKKYPAQAVNPTQGELIWMLDKDAAQQL